MWNKIKRSFIKNVSKWEKPNSSNKCFSSDKKDIKKYNKKLTRNITYFITGVLMIIAFIVVMLVN